VGFSVPPHRNKVFYLRVPPSTRQSPPYREATAPYDNWWGSDRYCRPYYPLAIPDQPTRYAYTDATQSRMPRTNAWEAFTRPFAANVRSFLIRGLSVTVHNVGLP